MLASLQERGLLLVAGAGGQREEFRPWRWRALAQPLWRQHRAFSANAASWAFTHRTEAPIWKEVRAGVSSIVTAGC